MPRSAPLKETLNQDINKRDINKITQNKNKEGKPHLIQEKKYICIVLL